jgi:hypothetical protein
MKSGLAGLRVLLAVLIGAAPAIAQIRPVAPSGSSALGAPALSGGVVISGVVSPGNAIALPMAAPALAAVPAAALASPLVAPMAKKALNQATALPAPQVGNVFDGAAANAETNAAEEAEQAADTAVLERSVGEPIPPLLEMFVTRESKRGVKSGQLNAHVGLIKGSGSAWYWGKFKKGGLIALKSGTQTMFVTKVEGAKTVRIASLQRKDFEGLFTSQRMAGKSTYQLRKLLVQDLKDRQARRPGAPMPVSTQSEIRLVRFMSSVKARELPENRDDSAFPAAPRESVSLPEALEGLNHFLPKTVLLDMRLFPQGVPYPTLEDMTKLMKTGVYFVLLSDKPNDGPGSVEDLLTRRLTVKQRDLVSRYKMVILSDDGNSLSGYTGNFARSLPSVRFSPEQLEKMAFVASRFGATSTSASTRFEAALAKGADAARAREEIFEGMRKMSLNPGQWQWSVVERDGRSFVTVRPQNLASALPHLLEVMRQHHGDYSLNSDLMLVSKDDGLRAALPGSVQPAAHLASDGARFADESLASLLGPYRLNARGDLAASASKIASFLFNPDGGGGDFGNVYMMTGHVMHSAFNWAIWKYRTTGVLPTAEETVEAARGIWEIEAGASSKNLLTRPGESLSGFYETVEQRLRAMHLIATDLLKIYPIVVGTELPNMYVYDRWKKGRVEDHRDIFRLIFDFVVARENAEGKLEVVIVDFKTGQVPTLQNLEKDTQVQLYDLLVRRMWKHLPVPYGGAGEKREVAGYKLAFLYTAGAYQPILNDWTRLKFDKFLKNVMNRIRRHNAPPPPKAAAPAPAKSTRVKIDRTRPKKAGTETLELPQTVPGLKIKAKYARQILAGTKKIEYRTQSTQPKAFIALVQTFTDEEPGRPAEVVGYARLEKVTQADGKFAWHLTHITPVKPFVAPNNKPGAITWLADIPVQGPRRLRK